MYSFKGAKKAYENIMLINKYLLLYVIDWEFIDEEDLEYFWSRDSYSRTWIWTWTDDVKNICCNKFMEMLKKQRKF